MSVASRQVAWVAVLEFVQRLGIDPTTVITAGTPAWRQLDDEDPDKLAAVLAAGVHHALRMDLAQEALAEASREIASAAPWGELGRLIAQGRGPAYVPRLKETA